MLYRIASDRDLTVITLTDDNGNVAALVQLPVVDRVEALVPVQSHSSQHANSQIWRSDGAPHDKGAAKRI